MIIGLIGKAGSGKDTVFEIIHDLWQSHHIKSEGKKLGMEYHQEFQNIKFAAKVKEICALLINQKIELFYDRSGYNTIIPGLDISRRELMQRVGDGLRQTVDNSVWVKATLNNFRPNENIIITDVRYPNELDVIKERGGILIRVIRPEHQESTLIGEQAKHSSETALDNMSLTEFITVINDGTLDDLRVKIKYIMDDLWAGS